MFRYSLATLLGIVLVSATGCAALVQANELWRQAVVTLIIALLLFATLAGLFGAGRLRAFGGGFAVVGWVYFALVFIPALGLHNELLTQRTVRSLWAATHQDESPVPTVAISAGGSIVINDVYSLRVWDGRSGKAVSQPSVIETDFEAIGHALWTLVLAFAGGLVTQWFAARRGAAPQQIG